LKTLGTGIFASNPCRRSITSMSSSLYRTSDGRNYVTLSLCDVKKMIYIAVLYAIRRSPQNRSTIPPCSLDPMPLPTIRRF